MNTTHVSAHTRGHDFATPDLKRHELQPDRHGNVGRAQLGAIMKELIDDPEQPHFDYINGVLSCEKRFGKKNLWFWWGNLLIVKPGQTRAGSMQQLDDWNTEPDGSITLIGKKQKESRL
jgi:hypothetical protein